MLTHPIMTLLALFVSMSLVGCGARDNKLSVSGSVTWNGQQIEDGYIQFYPRSGGNPSAAQVMEGHFQTRVTPGENIIQVTWNKKLGEEPSSVPGMPAVPIIVQVIPAQYNLQSELVQTFDKDNRTVELALTGEENKQTKINRRK